MPNLNIHVNYRRPWGQNVFKGVEGLRHLVKFLQSVADGSRESDSVKFRWNDSVAVQNVGSFAGQAAGLIRSNSGSGTVGATLGGTAVTVTWATSDTASMTALAAAIRANTTVNQFLTATNKLAALTFATVLAGDTTKVLGQIFTAIANGATPVEHGQFSIGASDTACALNFVTAVNRHPSLVGRVRAVSVAGVVYLGLVDDRTPTRWDIVGPSSSSTIAVTAATFAAGTRVMVLAGSPGIIGNFVTGVASGTGITWLTNGTAGQLGQGSGGATPSFTEDVVP